jgi:purine catabolism regulator
MTVLEMLQHYPFSESRVLAGGQGLSREVVSVNVVDAPDIVDWVKPAELLLTSAYALKDLADGPALIRGLAQKGAAGLGIKVGRFWQTIPDEVKIAADRLGFPILGLPLHFSLSDHLTHMYALILRSESLPNRHEVEAVLLKQVGIDNLLGNLLPLNAWMEELCQLVNREMVFYSYSRELPGWASPLPAGDGPWCDKVDQVTRAQDPHGRNGWRAPVMYAGIFYGWLFMYEGQRPFVAEEELLLRHAATVLGWRAQEATSKINLKLIDALNKTAVAGSWPEQVHADGFDFPVPFYCAVVATRSHPETTARAAAVGASASFHRTQAVVAYVLRQLRENHQLGALDASHWLIGEDVFMIMRAGEVLRYLPQIQQDLASDTGRAVWIGLSEPHASVCEWPYAFHEAWTRLKTGMAQFPNGGVFHQERNAFWLLWQDMDRSKMELFRDQVLGPVLALPERQLWLETLQAYFACEGKLDVAAQRLYLHRNTVAYRLRKIEELLHRRLKNPDDAVDIRLALSITEFM